MGRRPRQSGHLQGQFPLRSVVPAPCCVVPRHSPSHDPSSVNASWPQIWPSGLPQTSVIPPTEHWPEPVSPVSNRSTLSQGSGTNSAATTNDTSALAYARHLSPEVDSPTSSVISNLQTIHEASYGNARLRQPRPLVPDLLPDTNVQMTQDVVGIGDPTLAYYPPDYLRPPQFVSPRDLSPGDHQRYPQTAEPWSTLPFRHEDHWFNGHAYRGKSETMDSVLGMTTSQARRDRGGVRTGPLSMEQRQHASDVRREGACLRCIIMKEKCDTRFPCNTCTSKERRKIPKQCIRARFDWNGCKLMLFPDELTWRLKAEKLFCYLRNGSFDYSARPKFQISLDMNVGIPLNVIVKEFYPLDLAREIRHAHFLTKDADGSKSYKKYPVWSPPIIMFIKDGDLERQVKLVSQQIPALFEQVLDDPVKWPEWTTKYFIDRREDFQTTILELIGRYYRKDLKEHAIIKTALSLLWFEYLLLNKFTIPPSAVPQLETNLESPRPAGAHQDIHVIPDTINRFLKAIILPMAMGAARKITAKLHDMLFAMSVSQKLATAQTDIALCLAFVVLMFVGRTQSSLALEADSPAHETGAEYSFAEAETKIRAMEESVCDYLVSFHKYTLSRRSSARSTAAQTAAPASARGRRNSDYSTNSACEFHARQFDLVGRLRGEIEHSYAQERPVDFELGPIDLRTFPYMNVRRLCWKLFLNVENDKAR
ncbi:hypothetical protein A1O1_01487 [Capronia coronata CBS 617.96]|uniref:Zn(2)-C6 fungal-type domain-containing protein n=1 Tax=Capronia coronata CBS 617.96 TaxID=1182541 RepID=W9Z469_9EURO|nr:uncharacterized protein A1O1_01487 [Capronia coronata CBS 617.96]EXJ96361.1 hypothetical protein A1O1_01487 [Capronia coronata CBS 617.96]